MFDWFISIYMVSGAVMLIGVYITIKYRPYCTFNSPRLETAMEIYRKKMEDGQLDAVEQRKYLKYKRNTTLYSIGDFIVFIGVVVHIFTFTEAQLSSPLYLFGIFLVVPLFKKNSFFPYCVDSFPLRLLFNNEQRCLDTINLYQKKAKLKQLDEEESYEYTTDQYYMKAFEYYRYSINGGVVYILLLDVLFSLMV